MSRRTIYIPGYDHYSHKRNIRVVCVLNQAERAALDDLMAVLGVKNISAYIRGQMFGAYEGLTREQKRQLREVREWRAREAEAKRAGHAGSDSA